MKRGSKKEKSECLCFIFFFGLIERGREQCSSGRSFAPPSNVARDGLYRSEIQGPGLSLVQAPPCRKEEDKKGT